LFSSPTATAFVGREKTLLEVLQYLLPDLFPSDAAWEATGQELQLVVHGIPIPADVSIVELYRTFAYADGFLYVAVLPRSK
jgi:hypothetical protein